MLSGCYNQVHYRISLLVGAGGCIVFIWDLPAYRGNSGGMSVNLSAYYFTIQMHSLYLGVMMGPWLALKALRAYLSNRDST